MSGPKKVLMVSYYFPPLGMAGVQRVTKFVKYLPEFGWQPVVLTTKTIAFPHADPSLFTDVPQATPIYRAGSFDPLRLAYLWGRSFHGRPVKVGRGSRGSIGEWLNLPDNKIGFVPLALAKARRIVRQEKIDLVWTTSPPPSIHGVGLALKTVFRLPWVADFRDLWSGTFDRSFPSRGHRWLAGRWQKKFVSGADAVVAVSGEMAQRLGESTSEATQIFTIPNGFDPADLPKNVRKKGAPFTIAYWGTVTPKRSFDRFFAALALWRERARLSSERFRFLQIGAALDGDPFAGARRLGLTEAVEAKGYLPHRQGLAELAQADLFLLLIGEGEGSLGVLTGKLFEYLALGKPILALVPPNGEAARLIENLGAGMVVAPHNQAGMVAALEHFHALFLKKKMSSGVAAERLAPFSRLEQTRTLAGLFDRIVAKRT